MADINGVYYPLGTSTYNLPADFKLHAETDSQQALDAAGLAIVEAGEYTDIRHAAAINYVNTEVERVSFSRGELTSSDHLDNIFKAGSYGIRTDTRASEVGSPDGLAGGVIVSNSDNPVSDIAFQLKWSWGTGSAVWWRTTASGGGWGTWAKVAVSGDVADAIDTAKAYADAGDTATLNAANNYADDGDASTLSAAQSYADDGDASTLSSAEQYADTGDAATLTAAKSHADTGDAATLTAANSYADTGDATTLTAAQGYADAGDAATLSAANNYTDAEIAAARYTRGALSGGTDFDAVDTFGVYRVSLGSHPNQPVNATGSLEVLELGANVIQRFVSNETNPQTFLRRRSGGTWQPWSRLRNESTLPLNAGLNAYTTPGIYEVDSGTDKSNMPVPITGTLTVEEAGPIILQEYVTAEATQRTWVRRYNAGAWEDWQPKSPYAGGVNSGVDFNTVVHNGVYQINSGSHPNQPAYAVGVLEVLPLAAGILQRFTSHEAPHQRMYVRRGSAATPPVWGAWSELRDPEVDNLTGRVAALESGASNVTARLTSENLLDPTTVIPGYYVTWNSGTLVANEGNWVTPFIPVAGGLDYSLSPDGATRVAWYDSSQTFIGGLQEVINPMVAPAGAAFIRFSRPNFHPADATMFAQASTLPAFAPYGLGIDIITRAGDDAADGHHLWQMRHTLTPYDTGAMYENADLWRLHRAIHGDWDGQTFTPGTELTNAGAWETAISEVGSADFVGTWHGYEVKVGDPVVFVDGRPVEIAPQEFTAGEFRFVYGATLYRQGTENDAIARVSRDYRWTAEGLTLHQQVRWLQAVALGNSFLTMLPLLRDGVSNRIVTDYDGTVYDISAAGHSTPVSNTKEGVTQATAWHTTAGHTAAVTVAVQGAPSRFNVSPATQYNKFYFAVGRDTTTAVGDLWDITTTYRFAKA